MSIEKNLMIEKEEYRDLAKTALRELGIIEECEVCGYYYCVVYDHNEIYAKATNYAKKHFEKNIQFDLKKYHQGIKEIIDEAGFETIEEHCNH